MQLGRPLFLVGGVVFHALGVAMALYQGRPLDPTALVLGQLAITSAQFMTHYANDYFDLEFDRPNRNLTSWSGGSRILTDGKLQPRTALIAARALMALSLAAIIAAAIFVRPSPAAIVLLLAGLAVGWFYSAPPVRLVTRGWGEVAAAVTVPGFVTLSGLLLQGGAVDWPTLAAILPLILFQFVMLLGVAFPDAESDAETGKETLVVRLGGESAAFLHSLALALAHLTMVIAPVLVAVRGDFGLATWLLVVWGVILPMGLWHGTRVAGGAWCDPLQWGSTAFWGIALLVTTGVLDAVVFMAVGGFL